MSFETFTIVTAMILGFLVAFFSNSALRVVWPSETTSRRTVAVCCAILSLLGMMRMFSAPEWGQVASLDFVLIPWATLPLAILAILILNWLLRIFRYFGVRNERHSSSSKARKSSLRQEPHWKRNPDSSDRRANESEYLR
jgi:hypothetical protein